MAACLAAVNVGLMGLALAVHCHKAFSQQVFDGLFHTKFGGFIRSGRFRVGRLIAFSVMRSYPFPPRFPDYIARMKIFLLVVESAPGAEDADSNRTKAGR